MLYQPPTGGAANDPYVGANPGLGIQGSRVPPKAVEHHQRELVALISAAGLTPTESVLTQVAQAVSKGIYLGAAGGSANALTATIPGSVVFPALVAGMRFSILVATSNTGAATLDLTGFTADPAALAIVRPNGAALRQGDLVAGQIAEVIATASGFQLLSPGAADAPVGGTTVITATGTANFTVPANVFRLREVIVIGGGGGGGGGQNATTFSGCGGGGAAGGAAIKLDVAVTPGQVISTTVGVAGTAGTPALNGGTGGSSSFGAVCSATGGTGGAAASGGTVTGGVGSGGDINVQGADGGTAVISSGPQPKGGDGANGPLGYGGGGAGTITTAGNSANGKGGGGGGGGQNQNGGVGSPGLIIIRY